MVKFNLLNQIRQEEYQSLQESQPIILIIDPLNGVANPVYESQIRDTEFITEYRRKNLEED